jgi:Flp pilus assembly protein TadG
MGTGKRFSAWRDAVAGTAAIEFAICVPLIFILLGGLVEVGFSMYQSMQVSNSVEAGAVYAAKNGWDANGIAAAVTNATGTPGISASPAPEKFCGCPAASGVATAVCTATCTNGNTPGEYVRISAALLRQSIIPYASLGLPTSLTAQSIIRLK